MLNGKFKKLSNFFPQCWSIVHFPQQCVRVPISPHPGQLFLPIFFYDHHPCGSELASHCYLIFIFLMTNDIEHLFRAYSPFIYLPGEIFQLSCLLSNIQWSSCLFLQSDPTHPMTMKNSQRPTTLHMEKDFMIYVVDTAIKAPLGNSSFIVQRAMQMLC